MVKLKWLHALMIGDSVTESLMSHIIYNILISVNYNQFSLSIMGNILGIIGTFLEHVLLGINIYYFLGI